MMRRAQPWLGTLVEISIADVLEDERRNDAFAAAFAAIARVHQLMSFHQDASDVSRINRAQAGQRVAIDSHTRTVLAAALQIAEASAGVFDIGCAPVLAAWEYLPKPAAAVPPPVPAGQALRLQEDGCVLKLVPAWIDLGGIAKGYAVDLAIEVLRREGIGSACVNAGGDLRVLGETAWPIQIRSPRDPGREATRLNLAQGALASSSTVFSARRHAGRQISALLDGRDQRPLTEHAGATVCAPACMIADALTKVVAATGDATHACLQAYGATAFLL